jgi:hypothetical protein
MEKSGMKLKGLGGALLVVGSVLVLLGVLGVGRQPPAASPAPLTPTATAAVALVSPSPTPIATETAHSPAYREPLVPTPSPEAPTSTPDATSATLAPTPPATVAAPALPAFDFSGVERWRVGVSVPQEVGPPNDYDLEPLGVGWVMTWGAALSPPVPSNVAFAQTVRVKYGMLSRPPQELTVIAAANPGSLWLIGNEPDVKWQDNVEPEAYARLYHEAYVAIKEGDPTAVVAAGGITQPSPLRLRYLERVLASYREAHDERLPAQAWQIHNYMLREERGSWGVEIPPGFEEDQGLLYGIDDSGNLEAFRAQIYTFRTWMAAQGYGDLPLIVSEFGIAMPEDYGYPPERVAEFLLETTRFFATTAVPGLGDPNDGGRLVQRWCWFSLADPLYPTGNLIDFETREWTELGKGWLRMETAR